MHRSRVLRASVLGGVVLLAGAVYADQPVHVKVTVLFPPLDSPAGTLCDFNYHQEAVSERNVKRFFDEQGNLVRVERQEETTVLHQNADTGLTLTETVYSAVHIDLLRMEVRTTGNWWHLRDAEDRIVHVGSGTYTQDLVTGEILFETPNVGVGQFAQILCPLLGGAAAE